MKVIITGESDMTDNPPSIKEIGETLEELKELGLCKNIEECDIDKISKIIMDMGKEKPFPDITTQ